MVMVFKTNITSKQVGYVQDMLEKIIGIQRVSFDLEDCDNVLRIVSNHQQIKIIEDLVSSMGIFCKELSD